MKLTKKTTNNSQKYTMCFTLIDFTLQPSMSVPAAPVNMASVSLSMEDLNAVATRAGLENSVILVSTSQHPTAFHTITFQ